MWMHGWNSGWGGGAWWPLMALVPILFWGSIVALIVWGVSRAARGGGEASRQKTPLELADERYARGEITREQWEQLRADLNR